jgi:enamine deaminase RidA (YjgF/YER057c/UK114 family)
MTPKSQGYQLKGTTTMGNIDKRLQELGISVPEPAAPVANYVGWVRTGNLVYTSGQVPLKDGQVHFQGKVGGDLDVAQAVEAAQMCAINVISQVKGALDGDLDRVRRVLKLAVFVNATPEFTGHPEVANGASDLMVKVFGDKGRHARFAVGSGSLPRNVAVEVEGIFEVE